MAERQPPSIVDIRHDIFPNTEQPSFFWRSASYQTIVGVAALSRGFLFGLNKTQVHGLEPFLDLIKSRQNYKDRRKGLLTVSNHLSVIDDPLIWGVLPLSFHALHSYGNHRWALGSHDICFKTLFSSHFFTLGQTLPTHRLAHSDQGGPFQATLTEGVRLFCKISAQESTFSPSSNPLRHTAGLRLPSWPRDCVDPFSDLPIAPAYPSQANDLRHYLSPSRYACNSYSWIHVFPEGMIHQSPERTMRYFKWGFTRFILEPFECPDIVPIFIEGTDQIMHESRTFPRFVPRAGKEVTVTFGEAVDGEAVFGDLRRRWREIEHSPGENEQSRRIMMGIVASVEDPNDPRGTKFLREAEELRIECAQRVRDLVLAVRRSRGYSDEDPKASYAATWAKEGSKRTGKMEDGTWVGNT